MSTEDEYKEYYDLCYDVWRAGGDMDRVSMDRFDRDYEGHYDFYTDSHILKREMELQRPKPIPQEDEQYYQEQMMEYHQPHDLQRMDNELKDNELKETEE